MSSSLCQQLPAQFGGYELIEEIARGGMGVVFRARQLDLNRAVAVKMILSGAFADCADVRRFQAEAESAANLDHPGIVPIYEVGELNGRPYFSMALVEGESLAQLLSRNPIEAKRAASIIAQVADAIDYAHQQGIIHRDLKPANVLLDAGGRPRVTDFGVAKSQLADSDLTVEGELIGTPNFMSPEQARGEPVTFASDVYSLGAILYTSLTGRPPFQSANQLDTLHQVISEEVVAPRRLNPLIPQDLETITLKCLQKEPGRRYQQSRELSAELNRFLNNEPILTCPPCMTKIAAKWVRNHLLVAGMSGATSLLLVAGLIGLGWRCRYEIQQNQELSKQVAELTAKVETSHVRDSMRLRKWRCEYSEKLALFAQKEWRKDRTLALLLAAEAAGCAAEHEGEQLAPVVRETIEKMLLVTSPANKTSIPGKPASALVKLAKAHAGRELTQVERDNFLAITEEER